MQTFEQLVRQVGSWSVKNFGRQETPYLTVSHVGTIRADVARNQLDEPGCDVTVPTVVALGSLAPLMGMVEELGEFFDAHTDQDKADAIGDIAVYLCDYCYREGIPFPDVTLEGLLERVGEIEAARCLAIAIGRLVRYHLKRHQRIKGLHNRQVFIGVRARVLVKIVSFLECLSKRVTGDSLLVSLNATWNGVVQKRNWRADPDAGGGHTH